MFVGYQAFGTRGRTIQAGASEVKIFGKMVPIQSQVRTIGNISAHADRDEMIKWLKLATGSPKHVRIIHGETDAATEFASLLRQKFGWAAKAGTYLEEITL